MTAEQATSQIGQIGETGILSGVAIAVAAAPQAQPSPEARNAEPKGGFWWGTGRRKKSVARVRIKPGEGKILINERQIAEYFKSIQERRAVENILKALNAEKTFDIYANVNGGGTHGQAGAVVLGIARAMKLYDPNMLQALRDGGFLTRDSRMKERKKYGQRGARRRFQFSKR
ncbi:MAG TPA: 30S ribosomal protein S9 [Sedimentisphaerales bacterium]|nr:30S ribosomal protein S9 [Sedimentisphaerales bacterium]